MSRLEFRCRHRHPGGFALDLEFRTDAPVTALFGPSGAGKTTVLEIIAGLRRPDTGRVDLADRVLLDTRAELDRPPQERRIGFVFQDLRLFPHLTAERNLRFGQRRRSGANATVDFDRLVEVLELRDLLRRYPANLSGGERQRVALGRALLSSPDLLVMDEPLAAIDEALKHRILTYLERVLSQWRIPVLFVSHNQAEVRRLADRVVVIEAGRKVGEGRPEDALGQPGPLSWKDTAAPLNLLRLDEIHERDGHWFGRVGTQSLRLPPFARPPDPPWFVQFAPSAVILSRRDVPDISVRNHLQGIVRRIVEVPDGVFVAVDVGQILWAEVTPEAVGELELAPGRRVVCLIKTYSLDVTG